MNGQKLIFLFNDFYKQFITKVVAKGFSSELKKFHYLLMPDSIEKHLELSTLKNLL